MNNIKTRTKGNVIVEDIKIGDIHYEFGYGIGIKCEVISLPVAEKRKEDTFWTWQSKNVYDNSIINYGVSSKYPHYSANLYTNEAYLVRRWLGKSD